MRVIAFIILSFFNSVCLSQDEFSVKISIPIGSGIAAVQYREFDIRDNKLYIMKDRYLWDTSSRGKVSNEYIISDTLLHVLRTTIANTDSIGDHSGQCGIFFGWPRFFISFNYNGRREGGFIANVYRQHVYRIVDVINKINPDGTIINYDKGELIQREKDCGKFNH